MNLHSHRFFYTLDILLVCQIKKKLKYLFLNEENNIFNRRSLIAYTKNHYADGSLRERVDVFNKLTSMPVCKM